MGTTDKTKTRKTLKYRAKTLPVVWGNTDNLNRTLKLAPHSALSEFIANRPVDVYHWNALAFRVHTGNALVKLATPDVSEYFKKAIDVLDRSLSHFDTTGTYGFSREDLCIIGDALNLTDQLQDITTHAEQRLTGIEVVRENITNIRRIGLVSQEVARRWIS